MTGRLQKLETLGAVDGPGVRAVAFLQGCPLRCACCHNPETWELSGGQEIEAQALANRLLRYSPYFGSCGGITLSGGEPLMQAAFAAEVMEICKAAGIHTALDTSGCALDGKIETLLARTDLVLLDIKYTDEQRYRRYAGGSLAQTLRFLDRLEEGKIPTWLRQVSIPGLNDDTENLKRLAQIANTHRCVERVQLLPYKNLCVEKYDRLGIPFLLRDTVPPDENSMSRLNAFLRERLERAF